MVRLLMLGGGLSLLLLGSANADYTRREDVRQYMAELVAEHGFGKQELEVLFGRAERKQNILDAIARPAERVLRWHEYRDIFVKEPRISQGLEFWAQNAADLERAEARFGVPPEFVVAIIGVETRYGRVTGSYRVLDALTTLAFDYPPRSGFFRSELTHFLLLAREEGFNPIDLKGSYAGAMGYGQFIPSSFRAYAVDFDGDGRRDIWSNTADAIGSVANYFARHGWKGGAPVAMPVDIDDPAAVQLAADSLELRQTVAELRGMGIHLDGLSDDMAAALFRLDGVDGDEYWVGLNNFYVITRYNRSRMYALAVHQLASKIRQQREAQLAGR
jgi:membrane-bound lytic murein transglycosylase B